MTSSASPSSSGETRRWLGIDFDLEAEQIEDADILAELRLAQARTE